MRRTAAVCAVLVCGCGNILGPGMDSNLLVVDSSAGAGLFVGDTVRLTTREPDGSGLLVLVPATYSVTDTSVAAVNPAGFLIARAPGSTTLKVQTYSLHTQKNIIVDGNISFTMNIAPFVADLPVGSTAQFYFAVGTTYGNPARGKRAVWSSTDTSKATVDSMGFVLTKAPTTTRVSICATVTDGSGVKGCSSINITPAAAAH